MFLNQRQLEVFPKKAFLVVPKNFLNFCFGLMAYNIRWLFNDKAILLEEQQLCYLTHSLEDKGVHTFSQGYLSESERNSTTRVRTRLLRFRSPAL